MANRFVTDAEALSWGIWAINTLLDPDASMDEDWDEFEAKAETVLAELARMRERLR